MTVEAFEQPSYLSGVEHARLIPPQVRQSDFTTCHVIVGDSLAIGESEYRPQHGPRLARGAGLIERAEPLLDVVRGDRLHVDVSPFRLDVAAVGRLVAHPRALAELPAGGPPDLIHKRSQQHFNLQNPTRGYRGFQR